jgi:segregation and condensation protein B
MMMTPEELEHVLEAAIFAAAEPLTINQLAQMITEEDRPERDAIKTALEALIERYEERGVQLKQVASGYQFVTNPKTSAYMQRLLERKPPRYSRALLETLALIIYRQPITRGEIEQVRGVAVSTKIIQTLMEREWIAVVGHKAVPGQPALYAPTKQLFDYFNIKNMDELPPLADLVDLDDVGEKLSKQLALEIPEQEDHAEEVEASVLQPENAEAEEEVEVAEETDEVNELESFTEEESSEGEAVEV